MFGLGWKHGKCGFGSTYSRLILGAPQGKCGDLVDKMHAIQAKHGPFSVALVVGDFFAQESNQDTDDLMSGKKHCASRS